MNTLDEQHPTLRLGLSHREHMVVGAQHTVPHVEPSWPGFVDMPPVFATAMMIGFVEQTCITALRPYLSDKQRTVGTHVDVSHVAATPEGMTVTADITLTDIDGRTLQFDVTCHDESGLICSGTHRRAIVDIDAFINRVVGKKGQPRTSA